MTRTIKPELLHDERWEDEGGATVAIEVPISTGRFVRPMPKTTGFQDLPRQWSRTFVIEAFLAGTGSSVSKTDAASKK